MSGPGGPAVRGRDDRDLPPAWRAILVGVALVGCVCVLPQVFSHVPVAARPAQVGCWLVLLAVVPVWTALSRRVDDVLPVSVLCATGLAVVLAAGPALRSMSPESRFTASAWPWTCAGAVLISWSVCRRVRLAAVAAAVVAVCLCVWAMDGSRTPETGMVVLVVGELLLGPWAGLSLITLSRNEVRRRRVAAEAAARAARAARLAELGRADEQERLALLRDRALPLLEAVAAGESLPLNADRAQQARRLAVELRERLSTTSRLEWLFRAQVEAAGGTVDSLRVNDPDGLAAELSLTAQAGLAALVALLTTVTPWRSVVVTLSPTSPDGRGPGVLLVGDAAGAGRAAADGAVREAARTLGATVSVPGPDTFVVESDVLVDAAGGTQA